VKDFFNFASNNPWLTFFLFVIIGQVIVQCIGVIAKALLLRRKLSNEAPVMTKWKKV
jgi:hypothetical protein